MTFLTAIAAVLKTPQRTLLCMLEPRSQELTSKMVPQVELEGEKQKARAEMLALYRNRFTTLFPLLLPAPPQLLRAGRPRLLPWLSWFPQPFWRGLRRASAASLLAT